MHTIGLIVSVVMIVSGVSRMLEVACGYSSGRQKYREWRERYTSDVQQKNPGADEESDGNSQPGWEKAILQEEDAIRAVSVSDERDIGCRTEELTQEQTDSPVAGVYLPEDAPVRIEIDFEGLCVLNQDLAGWIELPAVGISYPIVQSSDNEFYLHHSLEKEYLFSGCIFLDAANTPDFTDDNSIIYGHNMRDGSMFAGLHRYCEQEIYEECPYFWIYTPETDYLYHIFSVHPAVDGSAVYSISFESGQERTSWYQVMKEQSVVTVEDGITEKFEGKDRSFSDGSYVTLSTCTAESGQKLVVQGERIVFIQKNTDSTVQDFIQ